jgi:Leucine-rich repeat (LRR) protein
LGFKINILDFLNCSNNQLTSLPELPFNLKILECNNNQLTSLPELPSTLEYLNCENNPQLFAKYQTYDLVKICKKQADEFDWVLK